VRGKRRTKQFQSKQRLGIATLTRNSLYNPKLGNPIRDDDGEEAGRPRGRVLALDVGKKRIGLAVSDELGITAQGIDTLHRTRIRDDLEKLKDIAREWNVRSLLIGKPLHMSGSESRQSEYTREFAERLGRYLELPVLFLDERLTTVEAERLLREAGASLEERKNAVDRLAAVLLLESYLARDVLPASPEEGGTLA
jgi:putative holliday junction resolvase